MKKSRFTESQIMAILKQHEAGVSIPELAREHGVSTASIYRWRAKFTLILVYSLYKFALLQRIRMVIFQNKSDANTLAKVVGLDSHDQKLIKGSGADLFIFDYQPENLDGPLTIVMKCRLLKEKGDYEFIEAARIVKRSYPDALCARLY